MEPKLRQSLALKPARQTCLICACSHVFSYPKLDAQCSFATHVAAQCPFTQLQLSARRAELCEFYHAVAFQVYTLCADRTEIVIVSQSTRT